MTKARFLISHVLHRCVGENPLDAEFVQKATAIHDADPALVDLMCASSFNTVEIVNKTDSGAYSATIFQHAGTLPYGAAPATTHANLQGAPHRSNLI